MFHSNVGEQWQNRNQDLQWKIEWVMESEGKTHQKKDL
jgi:hypothetical protein